MIQIMLYSGGITLRRFAEKDLEDFFQLTHSQLVKKYVPGAYTIDMQNAKELLANYMSYDFKNDFYFAIVDDISDKLIGALLAYRSPCCATTLEVSYMVHPDYCNHGICTTALRLFIKHLENHDTHYKELFFEVRTDNLPSRRVLEKIGIVRKLSPFKK